MSDYAANAELLVALSDLKVVQDVRRSIEANLIAAGGIRGVLDTYTMPQRRFMEEDIVILHDQPPEVTRIVVDHDVSVQERRVHDVDRVNVDHGFSPRAHFVGDETRLANRPITAVDPAASATSEPPLGHRQTPLVPPWRMVLPEEVTVAPRPVVKCVLPLPDLMGKGRLVDLFL